MHRSIKAIMLLMVALPTFAQQQPAMTLNEEFNVMKAHVEALGEEVDTGKFKMPMSIYLLQNDKTKLAAKMVDAKVITPFVSVDVDGALITDYQVAITYGHVDYLASLISHSPSKIDEPLIISANGDKLPLLSMLALSQETSKPYYENMVRMLLRAGAEPKKMDPLGLSPFSVASSFSNEKFINIVHAYEQEQVSGQAKTILINPPLSSFQLIEEQNMIDAYLELSSEEEVGTSLLVEEWFSAIIKGYNMLAETYYRDLHKREGFDIDVKSKKGLTALQATALSGVYGGNVSYAKTLIERGASVHVSVRIGQGADAIDAGLIDLALANDNHKVIMLYIKNGIDFLHSPNDPNAALLVQALQQEAYKSAVVLKTALDKAAQPLTE